MGKKSDNLSHHEQLRLDYLYKNIHYLNEREKKEYQYLLSKQEGSQTIEPARAVRSNFSDQQVSENFGYTEQGLPRYPERNRRDKRTKSERIPTNAVKNVVEGVPKPKKEKQHRKLRVKRILGWLAACLILIVGGMLFMFIKGLNTSKSNPNAKAAQTEVFHGKDTKDGVNILILGTDGRIGQSSSETRTDSIMVLKVGGKNKKMKLVSFMRDTLVHIDGVSKGAGYDQKLNVAYAIGEQNHNQGAELVRQVLKDNFDIDIKYYALVDFSTFATAIDTLFPNGVEMNANFSTINGEKVSEVQVPDDLNIKNGVVPEQTIKVGKQRMDGRTLLNYARFRKDDEGDFGRTRRQQEVMSAIIQQIKDPTKLFTGSEALGKVFALTSTNIPYSFLLTHGLSSLTNARNGVEKMTIPKNGDWIDAYDMYGGQGLLVDFEAYKTKLAKLGLR